jgi:hypothetical protein
VECNEHPVVTITVQSFILFSKITWPASKLETLSLIFLTFATQKTNLWFVGRTQTKDKCYQNCLFVWNFPHWHIIVWSSGMKRMWTSYLTKLGSLVKECEWKWTKSEQKRWSSWQDTTLFNFLDRNSSHIIVWGFADAQACWEHKLHTLPKLVHQWK